MRALELESITPSIYQVAPKIESGLGSAFLRYSDSASPHSKIWRLGLRKSRRELVINLFHESLPMPHPHTAFKRDLGQTNIKYFQSLFQ